MTDLKKVHYAICGAIQQKVYLHYKSATIEQLKLATAVEEWQELF